MPVGDEHDREDLIERVGEVTGVMPTQLRKILKMLSHPDVIVYTRKYFGSMDLRTKCERFEPPWSCVKDEDARYETIWDGWLTQENEPGPDPQLAKNWCEPCRRRVLEGLGG